VASSRGWKNQLFYGDNLDSLRKHVRDETVDLCYIDPPFNSKRNYNQIYNNIGKEDQAQAQAFIDTWRWDTPAIEGYQEIITNEGGRYRLQTIELIKGLKGVLGGGSLLAYLVSITQRVAEIHRVLKPNGSFYLHCDPAASHYLKLLLDGIFCGQGGEFQNEIIWKRTSAHNDPRKWGGVHDVLFFYTKSQEHTWNQIFLRYEPLYLETFFDSTDETGKRYKRSDLTGAGRTGGDSGKPWRNIDVTAKGRHWAVPEAIVERFAGPQIGHGLTTQEKLDLLDSNGRIHWPEKKTGMPRLKQFPEDLPGVPLQDVIADIRPLHNLAAERLGYPTQKPEALLERMIKVSSNEGDLVLDAYCGCGTTIAVAQRLKRRWIGMDITFQSISLVLKRLEDTFGGSIASTVVLDGAPKDMASAIALAHKRDDRLRKEFEKWPVLTYTLNRASINEKKGADAGIDGVTYFLKSKTDTDKMVFQVKSGKVGRGDIAKLKGDMERENASLATLITLENSTANMRAEAKSAGSYYHDLTARTYPRIRIVSIKQIVEQGMRLDLPLSMEAVKAARLATPDVDQLSFDYETPTTWPARKEPGRERTKAAESKRFKRLAVRQSSRR